MYREPMAPSGAGIEKKKIKPAKEVEKADKTEGIISTGENENASIKEEKNIVPFEISIARETQKTSTITKTENENKDIKNTESEKSTDQKLKKRIYRNRKDYALDDFIQEWQEHPEWHGLSVGLVQKEEKNMENGAKSFYKSFLRFSNKESNGDKKKSKELIERFFPAKRMYREDCNYTLVDFEKEWEEHPEWHGLSTGQVEEEHNKKSGANAFYQSLLKFARKKSNGNKEKRREIIERFFPAKRSYRGDYTLADFEKEWQEHLEWHGLSTKQVQKEEKNKISGAYSFYDSLLRFVNKESDGDKKKRRELLERFFPAKYIDRSRYTLDDYTKEWQEHPEWHGLSTEQAKNNVKSGANAFYISLIKFARQSSAGNEEKRRKIIEYFFPWSVELINADRGYILQYSLETILKIIDNKNLIQQKPFILSGRKRELIPDLVYEYQDGDFQKAIILDIKLQTTTAGIDKDKKITPKFY